MHLYRYIYVYIYTNIHEYKYIWIHIYMYTHKHAYIHINICIYTCLLLYCLAVPRHFWQHDSFEGMPSHSRESSSSRAFARGYFLARCAIRGGQYLEYQIALSNIRKTQIHHVCTHMGAYILMYEYIYIYAYTHIFLYLYMIHMCI